MFKGRKGEIYEILFYIASGFILILILLLIASHYSKTDNSSKDSAIYNSPLNNMKYSDISPPYVFISNRTVFVFFNSLNGSIEKWAIPFESLEEESYYGYKERADNSSLKYAVIRNPDGKEVNVVDFRKYVQPEIFKNVIPEIYQNSPDDEYFIREVWNIVTQLDTYSSFIGETPRYPLETLLSGGGDCDNTAVLFASLIKATPTNWKTKFVYMDINNPENPKEVNHLIVSIETQNKTYLIDTTQNSNIEPFKKVYGWYIDI